jgi:hypothetical protein
MPEGPSFESAASRSISINLSREDIEMDKLTEMQKSKGMLSRAMSGYIHWVAECYGRLARELPETRDSLRDGEVHPRLPEGHPRTPNYAATLILALRQFEKFTVGIGAMDEEDAMKAYKNARNGVLEAAAAHTDATQGSDPSTRFIEILGSLFTSGEIYVTPKNPRWTCEVEDSLDLEFSGQERDPRSGKFVGWEDENYLYLEKEAAYAAVAAFTSRGGISFGTKQKALWSALARSGKSLTDSNRTDTTVNIEGKIKRVIQIPRSIMS